MSFISKLFLTICPTQPNQFAYRIIQILTFLWQFSQCLHLCTQLTMFMFVNPAETAYLMLSQWNTAILPSLGEVYSFLQISCTPPWVLILLTPSRPRSSISSRSCLSVIPYWAGRPSIVAMISLSPLLAGANYCYASTRLPQLVLFSGVAAPLASKRMENQQLKHKTNSSFSDQVL